MELIDLIQSIDIVDYISQFVELKENNGEFWGLSPFKEEKTPSFSVRRETNSWYDFSSGLGGNCFTFIRYYNKCSNKEAVDILKQYAGCGGTEIYVRQKLPATMVFRKYTAQKKVEKPSSSTILPPDYMNRYEDKPEKLQIWRDEGISDASMKEFGVKYDSFSNCIVYPIRNIDGNIVNIGGRTLDPNYKEKNIRKYTYFKPWGGQMSIIYGLFENLESIKAKKEVILFEGMKSVLIAREYGYKNTGAILTSHLNPGQMKILAKLGVNVVFALDKDVDVLKDHNIEKLKRYVRVKYIKDTNDLIEDKDSPVDKGKEIFDRLYESKRIMR